MEERRKYVRVPEKSQISYSLLSEKENEQYTTSNVSQGGIRFLVHHFIPKGSSLKISMSFPKSGITVNALVKTVWAKGVPHSGAYEVGVKFLDISPEAAEDLARYVKSAVGKGSGAGRYSM